MSDTQIKSVALFFFFAFFNEQKALDATHKVLRLVRKRNRDETLDTNALIVRATHKIFLKNAKKLKPMSPPQDLNVFQIPEEVSLEYVQAIRKRLTLEEFTCLMWTHVFGLSETTVALALDSSLGTIRHRNSNAVQILSQVLFHKGTTL